MGNAEFNSPVLKRRDMPELERTPRSLNFEQRLEFNEGDIGVSGKTRKSLFASVAANDPGVRVACAVKVSITVTAKLSRSPGGIQVYEASNANPTTVLHSARLYFNRRKSFSRVSYIDTNVAQDHSSATYRDID